jgi:hypothetical protein
MINEVRNTVLSILNKNNYGYISPADFNLFAEKSQLELFEEYFSQFNKVINMENARMSGTEYGDLRKKIMENIEIFSVTNFLLNYTSNKFYIPSPTTTGDDPYMITKILVYPVDIVSGTSSLVSSFQLVDPNADFIASGVKVDDIVINTVTNNTAFVVSVDSPTVLTLTDDIFTLTYQDYRIVDAATVNEAEKVSHNKITMLNNSLLTAPSNMFPAYVQEGHFITVFPRGLNYTGKVQANYFRFPKTPKWTYITLLNGEPVFDQSQPDYQDFEIPKEDSYKVALKILGYCGMSIRELEATQFAVSQEIQEQPTFSQKQ